MRRVEAACICQTLHFTQKSAGAHDDISSLVKQEVEHYKKGLERNRVQYKIVEELDLPDGSTVIKIIKQYNSSPVGSYLN